MGAAVGLALIAGSLAAGCGGQKAGHDPAHQDPVRVSVARVGSSTPAGEIVVAARVRAREEVSLTATTAANLTALPVAEGGRFAAGRVLARFEAPETRDALAAAQSGLAAANLRLETARRQEKRVEALLAERLVPEREADLARAERQTAEAEVAAARAALARWSAATVLEAPFAGTVVRHRVDVGTRVQPGQPVIDVRSGDRAEIEASIPESAVEDLAQAQVWVQVGSGAWLPARVHRIEGIDFASRTRLAFLRPSDPAIRLEPGAYARVRVASAARRAAAPADPGAILVPLRSLVRRGALTGVYVVREGKAELRWLKPGRAVGDSLEVLAGLWAGEDVALDPRELSDGRPVETTR